MGNINNRTGRCSGDKYVLVEDSCSGHKKGEVLYLCQTDSDMPYVAESYSEALIGNHCGFVMLEHLKFVGEDGESIKSSSNNNMSIKSKFTEMFLSEPEKTFRKAGITNGDGFLTSEGQEVFLTYLLKKHGPDFKKEVVDELVKESEEK